MRYVNSSFRLFALMSAVAALAALAACGGGADTGQQKTDSAAAAAVPSAAPPAESFALAGEDGSWTVDINPAGIVFHRKKGAKMDSIVFDYKAPKINGAISEYTSFRKGADTLHRIDISMAMAACTDKANMQHTHMAQVWVDQKEFAKGCGDKKR